MNKHDLEYLKICLSVCIGKSSKWMDLFCQKFDWLIADAGRYLGYFILEKEQHIFV